MHLIMHKKALLHGKVEGHWVYISHTCTPWERGFVGSTVPHLNDLSTRTFFGGDAVLGSFETFFPSCLVVGGNSDYILILTSCTPLPFAHRNSGWRINNSCVPSKSIIPLLPGSGDAQILKCQHESSQTPHPTKLIRTEIPDIQQWGFSTADESNDLSWRLITRLEISVGHKENLGFRMPETLKENTVLLSRHIFSTLAVFP